MTDWERCKKCGFACKEEDHKCPDCGYDDDDWNVCIVIRKWIGI